MRNIFKKGSLYSRPLRHSAEGTTWKKHRYVKVVDDKYYYPDDYEGGRHISSLKSSSSTNSSNSEPTERKIRVGATNAKHYAATNAGPSETTEDSNSGNSSDSSTDSVTNADIEELANAVIRGEYGNGQARKEALGELYGMVQSRVNELMRGSTGFTKVSQVAQSVVNTGAAVIEAVVAETEKAASTDTSKSSSTTTSTKKGLDFETIFSVYRK